MKTILIFPIRFYQLFISPFFHAVLGPRICRYNESCSNYAIRIIKEKGVVKGIVLSFLRLLSCQPFSKYFAKAV